MQIASVSRAIRSERAMSYAAPWARRRPRRWPSSASASSRARPSAASAEKAEKIFDLMAKFAGYGFNKSHSAAYALLAYQTAYLKTHYPVEFMAALLTSETGNTDKWSSTSTSAAKWASPSSRPTSTSATPTSLPMAVPYALVWRQ